MRSNSAAPAAACRSARSRGRFARRKQSKQFDQIRSLPFDQRRERSLPTGRREKQQPIAIGRILGRIAVFGKLTQKRSTRRGVECQRASRGEQLTNGRNHAGIEMAESGGHFARRVRADRGIESKSRDDRVDVLASIATADAENVSRCPVARCWRVRYVDVDVYDALIFGVPMIA